MISQGTLPTAVCVRGEGRRESSLALRTHPEFLEGEVGNDGRVAATVDRVAVVREQGLLRDRAVHAVRLRVDALHLVEDDALEGDVILRCIRRLSVGMPEE